MKLARGPRPVSIRVFVITFLLASALRIADTYFLPDRARLLAQWLFGLTPDDEAMIVFTSASITVALIPVAMVWFLAQPLARILVIVMFFVNSFAIPIFLTWRGVDFDPSNASALLWLLMIVTVIALYWPSSSEWFKHRGHEPDAVFK